MKRQACASLDTEASSSTKFSGNSSNHSGRSRNGSRRVLSLSPFLFLFLVSFGSRNESPSARRCLRPLGVFAGTGEESSCIGSCDTAVEAVLSAGELGDPVDELGATMGTWFSVCCLVSFCLLFKK